MATSSDTRAIQSAVNDLAREVEKLSKAIAQLSRHGITVTVRLPEPAVPPVEPPPAESA